MESRKVKLIIGSLLHDIGKVLCRYRGESDHSISGYEYLKDTIRVKDDSVLEQVRYHHTRHLKDADLPKNSPAYITSMADDIISGAERRDDLSGVKEYNPDQLLESVFNLLNNNDEKMAYKMRQLDEFVNYPETVEGKVDKQFYGEVLKRLEEKLEGIDYTEEGVKMLLELLETELIYVPSSDLKGEVSDISLYDHLKLTAAFASCIDSWLQENGVLDYKACLFDASKEFYSKKAFLIFNMNMSGIQDFIYTISSEDALKTLRSRSFYLEILMEHLIDELLERLGLSRANIMYSGGGNTYLILPNTEPVKVQLKAFDKEVNDWLLDRFSTALFLGCGYGECSAMDLRNEPKGAYRRIFADITDMVNKNKVCRYSADQLIALNKILPESETRECKVCRSVGRLTEKNICTNCESMIRMSGRILHQTLFAVTDRSDIEPSLPLPFGRYMIAESKFVTSEMDRRNEILRMYTKNEPFVSVHSAQRLWVGDYTTGDTFEGLANSSQGVKRLAVLRADVDNLGNSFVNGFAHEKYDEKYMTISRTATFSRKMSIFFKNHINTLLKEGRYYIGTERESKERQVSIVYAGGDDIFIVGSWDEVIGLSIDMVESFKKFSQNTLSISGGIGIYPGRFPISTMAREVGELEEAAKGYPGKNAVALFNDEFVFSWEELKTKILDEKVIFLQEFFAQISEKGSSFLYKIMELIQDVDVEGDRINLARLAYTIARLEEELERKGIEGDVQNLSRKIYEWAKDPKERKYFVAAMYVYAYLSLGE